MKYRYSILLFKVITLSACHTPSLYIDQTAIAIPRSWQTPVPKGTDNLSDKWHWWRQFNSAELVRLIQLAYDQNLDRQAALYRIKQTRALLKSAEAASLAQLSAELKVADSPPDRVNHSNKKPSAGSGDSAKITLAYELDLWQRFNATQQAAYEKWQASQYDAAAISLILETEVASTYFQLCALTEQVTLQKKSTILSQSILSRMQIMQALGAISQLDLIAQRQRVAESIANVEMIKSHLQATRLALATLVGLAPDNFDTQVTSLDNIARPVPQATQPSILLTRRPDLLRTEANLRAANANIRAARAALFPHITISATGIITHLFTSHTFKNIFTANLASIIFDGGKLRAIFAETIARHEELTVLYQQAVLQALKESENALYNLHTAQQREKQAQNTLQAAQTLYDLNQVQYKLGNNAYIALIKAKQSLMAAQEQAIGTQQEVYKAVLALYKALGGAPILPSSLKDTQL